MAIQNNLKKGLDRKLWQVMTPCPTTNAAAMFVVSDPTGEDSGALYFTSVSTIYRYRHDEDAWSEIPASGIAGTFGAGACGSYHRLGPSGTATAGTTTTITTNLTIPRSLKGYRVRITAGPAAGEERDITTSTQGTNAVITVSPAFSTPITAASQYQLLTGRFWFFNPSTTACGFAYWDRATNTWTQRAVTNLPASFGTDGRLIATFGDRASFAVGTATAGAATTLTNGAKNWTTNQWTNHQVRITAGTGAGQIRTIASNTATVLTVASSWTTNPDATSQYVIEGNDDYIYLLGNNAVTMYRYSISGNTWTTLSPGVARGAAFAAGGGANWICEVSDATWTDENNIKNGRYIYSFRGGASSYYDIYDIAANTWINAPEFGNRGPTFTTGSCYEPSGDFIYIQKEATGRIFRLDLARNVLDPFSTNLAPNSTATVGDKLWSWKFVSGSDSLTFVYQLGHTVQYLSRCLVI